MLASILSLFVMAPTPGDIGGCGQQAQLLDARVFYATKRWVDCDHCRTCGLRYANCTHACDQTAALPQTFPEGCYPLVHDGEVCLHALHHASCDDYGEYMSDDPSVATTASECNFCPVQ